MWSCPGVGDIQTVEDFLVSSNIMPLGSLVYVLFCVSRRGWGWKNFLAEANEGEGLKFPRVAAPVDALRRAGARGHHSHHGLGAHRQLVVVICRLAAVRLARPSMG